MIGSFAARLAMLAKGAGLGGIDVTSWQYDDGPRTYQPIGRRPGESWPTMNEVEFEAWSRTHHVGLIRHYVLQTRY